MRAERRHELQTNELAQQIDVFGDYIKKHAGMLTAIFAGAVIVVVGIFWMARQRQNTVLAGWSTLNDSELLSDPTMAIDKYRQVAEEAATPALAIEAWLKVGETAMTQHISPSKTATSQQDWSQIATDAFTKIVQKYEDHPIATAVSRLSLGILAENKGQTEAAREQYEKVVADKRIALTPYPAQARFRIDHLEEWTKPIEFPPPPIAAATIPPIGDITQLIPTTQAAGQSGSSTAAPATSQPFDPELYYVNENNPYPPSMFPASAPAQGQPTTQPAG